jgi:hypothetical protein
VRDRNRLTIVPEVLSDIQKSIVSDAINVWPRSGNVEYALLLEAEPEFWHDTRTASSTSSVSWPGSAIRNAGVVGSEVRVDRSGFPWVTDTIVQASSDWFWHRLTLAFTVGQSVGSQDEWRRFRDEIAVTLDPSKWTLPTDFLAVLFLAEGSFGCFCCSDAALMASWTAQNLEAAFSEDISLRDWPELWRFLAVWIMKNASGVGVRLTSIERSPWPRRQSVVVTGRWGRGKGLITTGRPGGTRFSLELTIPE